MTLTKIRSLITNLNVLFVLSTGLSSEDGNTWAGQAQQWLPSEKGRGSAVRRGSRGRRRAICGQQWRIGEPRAQEARNESSRMSAAYELPPPCAGPWDSGHPKLRVRGGYIVVA
ncbi:hypothetical protein BJY52DRAFT_1225528 [Lactarius psammicola]|nr:hypothetical protein BJY52DRAFT_1225528 [Lactarius psammicola]